MTDEIDPRFGRLLAAFEDRSNKLEASVKESFKEFKGDLKEVSNNIHGIDKSLEAIKAANLPDRLDKLSSRVSTLEIWRSWIMGGLAVLGLIVGYLLKKLL
jgi:hypothetical protein